MMEMWVHSVLQMRQATLEVSKLQKIKTHYESMLSRAPRPAQFILGGICDILFHIFRTSVHTHDQRDDANT